MNTRKLLKAVGFSLFSFLSIYLINSFWDGNFVLKINITKAMYYGTATFISLYFLSDFMIETKKDENKQS